MDLHGAERVESQNQPPNSVPHPPKFGTSFLRTCFNGLNTLSGVGIISIPYALSQGGWLGLLILFFVAILCCYTSFLLRRCMDIDPLIKTYPDIGKLAFGAKGRALVSTFMYLELYLIAVEFLILEGDNLNKLFPNASFLIFGKKVGGKQCFVVLAALVIMPTTWLKNMGLLAYVSAGGVLATLVLIGSIFWVGEVDVFPTIYISMKDKSQFSKVLLVCFALATISYGSTAILGYLMFGQNVMSQVTLNLPTRPLSSKIAIYSTLINPITKYAIIVSPIATAIEDTTPFYDSRPISLFIRTILVISTMVVALTIPFFGYVMAFIGSFLSISVSILFPCLCYLKIYRVHKHFGSELILIVAILAMGFLVAVMGTYTSLREIVKN
ncbi:hypothetical protein U1Q18_025412 [Sarracenia purpurea var. burkii]